MARSLINRDSFAFQPRGSHPKSPLLKKVAKVKIDADADAEEKSAARGGGLLRVFPLSTSLQPGERKFFRNRGRQNRFGYFRSDGENHLRDHRSHSRHEDRCVRTLPRALAASNELHHPSRGAGFPDDRTEGPSPAGQ